MQIIFSVNNGQDSIKIPIPPTEVDVNSPQNNSTFNGINGDLNLIGNMGLRSFPLDGFFPNQKYTWLSESTSYNAWEYVEFFERYRKAKIPFRCFIIDNDRQILNMPCTIDDFNYKVKRNKDIGYTMMVREYRFGG
jgi:hypothetical protein